MDSQQILAKLTHLPYYLYLRVFKAKMFKSGLFYVEPDPRNFETEKLGWSLFGGYTPKNSRVVIEPVTVFNQGNLNVCVFCGTLSHHMDAEKVELDISDMISYAVRQGWVSGNGLTSVDTGMKVLKAYGCAPGANPEVLGPWESISSKPLNTVLAAQHKIASYWSVTSRDDRLKLLDEGKTLNTGIDWYTGFNMGGGFSAPWIITKPVGYKVGGHDIKICGYDLNYNSRKVYIIQNSYGKQWGFDSGKFYIDMDYFDAHNFGVFCSLDVESNFGSFINKYDGKNVRGSESTIYFIQAGKKKVYPNWATYLAFGGKYSGFTQLSGDEVNQLNNVPAGDNMDIQKSPAWSAISSITELDDSNHNLMSTLINLSAADLGINQ